MDRVETFEEHRGLLFSVAYRMLGSVAEAEDVVQDAWLRWEHGERDVRDPAAYLVTITTRLSLDHLRRAKSRRESYVGAWLPEPLVTTEDAAEAVLAEEDLSFALLVVMETLSPLERAVFVLREAFGYTYPEIATALDRSEQAVRQLAHRAREHVQARRPRFHPDREVRQAATERFVRASLGGDLAALMDVLAPDVTLWADTGGIGPGPKVPVRGQSKVARLLTATARDVPPDATTRFVDVNGAPGVAVFSAGRLYAVCVVEMAEDGQICDIRLISNPEKLATIAL